MASAELEVTFGLRAGLAVFSRRRADIERVVYARAVRAEVTPLTRWASSCQVPCIETTERELERLAKSAQNEGLCVVAKPRRWLAPKELGEVLERTQGAALALDRVRNPYNIGALIRTAAFFDLEAVLLGAPAPHPGLVPTAVRVAEGGAEHIRLSRTTDLAATLARLRERGVRVVGAEGAATTPAIGFAFERPAVIVVGNERGGVGERIRSVCDAIVAIPGGRAVESLNVSVAGGILMSELVRGNRHASAPSTPRSEKR